MTKAIVIHSGGMDSSLCLALAIQEYSNTEVISLSFDYGQRHRAELIQAAKICSHWNVEHHVLSMNWLPSVTKNALTDANLTIESFEGTPNTLVVGRNGLMARLGAIFAQGRGAQSIYMGVMGLEEANSGYRDCSRSYMDLKQQILRLDLNDPEFEIRTPLVHLNKKESLQLASKLGILDYLLEETISCYEGISREGCKVCPACLLKNEGLANYFLDLEKK